MNENPRGAAVDLLLRLIDPVFTRSRDFDYGQRRLLARRMQITAKVFPMVFLVALCVLVVVVARMPASVGWFRWVWTTLIAGSGIVFTTCWLVRARNREREPALAGLVLLVVQVVTWGLLLAWLSIVLYPRLDAGEELFLTSVLLGAMVIGLCPIVMYRGMAVLWLALIGAGLGLGFWMQPSSDRWVLIGILGAYIVSLYGGTMVLAKIFDRRLRAELDAEDQRDLVGLLLGDLEDGAQGWLWETDANGVMNAVSYRFAESVELPASEIRGRTMREILVSLRAARTESGRAAMSALDVCFENGNQFRDIEFDVWVNGRYRRWSMSGRRRTEGLSDVGWRGVGSDITRAYRQRQYILELATVDSLTGLYNWRTFTAQLSSMIADGAHVWLGMFDLDNFKSINDCWGHRVGDNVLRNVAESLHSVLRPGEICARFGGDEFGVAFCDIDDEFDVRDRFQAVVDAVDVPFLFAGSSIRVRGSLGYGSLPVDATTFDELVVVADLALYHAKSSGRNQIRRFDSALREQATGRARALLDLRMALRNKEFELAYQPQVSASSGAVVCFEALLRWNHPVSGTVGPGDFISVAEETGLIVPIGDEVLRIACAEAATWPDDVRVAVNVSQVQLRSTGYVDSVRAALRETPLAPERLEIEVTESLVIDDVDRQVLVDIAALGVAIAMDDFGTGFSSVASLSTLPLDRLKIDRTFVSQLDVDLADAKTAVFRAVVDIAESMGLETVAEGVETQRQRAVVTECGCRVIQGFLEGRPMPASEVRSFIESRRN